VFFQITNCLLIKGGAGINFDSVSNGYLSNNIISESGYNGVYIVNSHHLTLIGNNISSNQNGISLTFSQNNTISDNILNDNSAGIALSFSDNNTISNNNITGDSLSGIRITFSTNNNISSNIVNIGVDNTYYIGVNILSGIDLSYSGNNILSDNILVNCSFNINAFDHDDYLQAEVTNNVVNGKPLVYWENVNGGTIPAGAGQIILVNCTSVEVTAQEMTEVLFSIMVISSFQINIHDNILTNISSGITLSSTVDSNVSGNTITGTNFGGIYGISLDSSSNNEISNNAISFFFSGGISLSSSTENTISGNILTSNAQGGIFLMYSGENTIKDNVLNENGLEITSGDLNSYLQAEVSGNTINGKSLIFWQNRTDETVPNGAGQIILVNCDTVEVTGQELTDVGTALLAVFSSNLNIHNNQMAGNGIYGISIQFSDNSIVSNNIISENTRDVGIISFTGNGIQIQSSEFITVSSNTISDSSSGINVYDSDNNLISGNTLSEISEGISLLNAEHNTVSENSITGSSDFFGSSWYGISLMQSSQNNISSNTVSDFFIGISISFESNDNSIEFNILIDNDQQATDDASNNIFDYNFWNDLTEPDTNSDGIVDESYSISGSAQNQDNHPRVTASGSVSIQATTESDDDTSTSPGWNGILILFSLITIILVKKRRILK
ncbi:MAG: NosD domain-containing protein, partial [Candidatus Neomarinimicrobiota bacterium]